MARQRVDRVHAWRAEAAAIRPRGVTLYVEMLDEAARAHGPDSEPACESIETPDRVIGLLHDTLQATGPLDRVDPIITPDHGRDAAGNPVAIDDMVAPTNADALARGESTGFKPQPVRKRSWDGTRLGRAGARPNCRRRHCGMHPRIPAIVRRMDNASEAVPRSASVEHACGPTGGSHGRDPHLASRRTGCRCAARRSGAAEASGRR